MNSPKLSPLFAGLCAAVLLVSQTAAAAKIIPAAPKLAATGYILMDFHSGHVLEESEADTRMEPASLTKMMSAYVVSDELRAGNIRLEDKVTISEKAWRMPGSRMFIEVNKQVAVQELLKGVIVQSGNDATVALAEHVAGSEEAFASLMNQYAKTLGLSGTHFVNSTGLPHTEHYTTPRDMARMAQALIRDFPEHYAWYSIKEYTFNDIRQYNRNRLLWRDRTVDGVKTGHTESAGYCLVASADRDGMRLISVVLGTKSERAREQESQKLLNFGYRFYATHRLYGANESLADARVFQGEADALPLGLDADLYVTIPRGRYKQLKPSVSYEAVITAPVEKGRSLGTVTVNLGETQILERPLRALKTVPEGGWWKRLIDWFKLLFYGWFN